MAGVAIIGLQSVNNELYPVISLNYQCVEEGINSELWQKILIISYTQEATDGIHKTENTVKGLRTFSTPTPNPYLTLSQENPDALINPTIEITYTCKDQKLDKKLWESILTNAEIKS